MDEKCCMYLWRQLLIMTTIWLQGASGGVMLAYPSILTEKTISPHFKITSTQENWLHACISIFGVLGFVILSCVLQTYGRKPAHITLLILHLVSWLTLYFATSFTYLLIGRAFHGICFGVIYINGMIISEYSSPSSRGYYITTLKIAVTSGSLLCRCLSFWTWREPALAAAIIIVTSLLLNLFWPESPPYYAMKGRFVECKNAFLWLHGASKEKKKELNELLAAQMEDFNNKTQLSFFRLLLETVKDRNFLKALLLASLITFVVDSCGRFFVIVFIIKIMRELVGNASAIHYSIIVDCCMLLAFALSCILLKFMKRRTILFTFGVLTSVLMFAINLVLFLKNRYGFTFAFWFTPSIIVLQSFIVNLSLIPICFTLLGEIFPLEHRGIGSCASGMVFSIFYGLNMMATPVMMRDLGVGGTYGTYGLCLLLSLLVLYFILPETKCKTLQKIEDEMKNVQRDNSHVDDTDICLRPLV